MSEHSHLFGLMFQRLGIVGGQGGCQRGVRGGFKMITLFCSIYRENKYLNYGDGQGGGWGEGRGGGWKGLGFNGVGVGMCWGGVEGGVTFSSFFYIGIVPNSFILLRK